MGWLDALAEGPDVLLDRPKIAANVLEVKEPLRGRPGVAVLPGELLSSVIFTERFGVMT